MNLFRISYRRVIQCHRENEYPADSVSLGNRGGARVIYFHLVDDEIVLLVMVYAKAERTNVKAKDIKRSEP